MLVYTNQLVHVKVAGEANVAVNRYGYIRIETCSAQVSLVGVIVALCTRQMVKWQESRYVCFQGAAMAAGGGSHPVVIFSHGLGGCRNTYSVFCAELASQVG